MAGDKSKPKRTGAAAPYRLEDQVGHLLRRAHQRATAIFQTTIGDKRITPTQYAALVKLHDAGELSQNLLGRMTPMDPATIQGVTRRLKARRLVAVRSDPNDRRRSLLRLTDPGVTLITGLIPNGPAVSAATLGPLSPADRRTFLALLKRIT